MSTIVLRSVKGTPLTNTEVDANFSNLNTDKLQIGGTYSSGTANGVLFLNSSKVLTTGSALTFSGTKLSLPTILAIKGAQNSNIAKIAMTRTDQSWSINNETDLRFYGQNTDTESPSSIAHSIGNTGIFVWNNASTASEQMRLTSTGLGIGTSSPESGFKLHVLGNAFVQSASGTIGKVVVDSVDQRLVLGAYFEAGVGQYSFISSTNNAETGDIALRFRTGTTDRMTITNTGDVGIGTSSPAGKLDIVTGTNRGYFDDSAGSLFRLNAVNAANSAYAALSLNGSVLTFQTGASERMRIDTSGNLGLGVTPSAWDSTYRVFQIGGNPVIAGQEAGNIVGNAYFNAGWKYMASSRNAARYEVNQNNGGIHAWYTAPSGTAGNAITFTQALTLDASGYLLVGATSTAGVGANRLQVGSTSAATTQVLIQGASTHLGLYAASAAEFYAAYAVGSAMIFGNGPANGSTFTERARIDSSGNFLLAEGGTFYGLNQYANKKMMKFEYPTTGFGAFLDCLDFATPGSGSGLVQMRVTQQGNVGCRSSFLGGQTLNDYAEYFEWFDGNPKNEDRIGVTVVLDGDKIRPSTEQDSGADIFGVVSGTAGVVLGSSPFEWAGKYQKDEFGRIVTEKVTWVYWNDGSKHFNYKVGEVPDGVDVPASAEYKTYDNQVIVAGYNESAEYKSRDQRKEWAAIGLVGQVHVKAGQLVGDRWRKMKDVSNNVAIWLIR